MEVLLYYLLLGGFAGILAGMLGVGGGLIIVPVLAEIFYWQKLNQDIVMHVAIATSLATICVTSLSSTWAHHRHNAVLWKVFVRLTPGILLGAFIGSWVADYLASDMLKKCFGLFELFVAVQMGLAIKPAPGRDLPGFGGLAVVGVLIGKLSAIVGIGGGTMTVPFLVWCNVSIRNAVATSAAIGFPIAVGGVAGYIVAGWEHPGLPQMSTAYIYWPAFAGVSITSLLLAPVGARLAHSLPVNTLKRLFSLILFFIGIRMLLS